MRSKHDLTRGNAWLRPAFVAAMGIACASCERTPRTPPPPALPLTVLSAQVQEALAGRAAVLQAPRATVRFGDGTTVANCTDYLKVRQGMEPAADPQTQQALSEYLICDALGALATATAMPAGAQLERGARLAEHLDLRGFPSSLGERVDSNTHTLAALGKPAGAAGGTLKVSGAAASLEDEAGVFRLQVIAEADVDQDGKLDWLVWMSDEARNGQRDYRTLLVSGVAQPGPLSAIPYKPTG